MRPERTFEVLGEVRPARTFDVLGVGETSMDQLCVLPRHPEAGAKLELRELTTQGGGQIATALVACARLGLSACFVGAIGDDEAGVRTLEELGAAGVDVSQVRTIPGGRSRQAVVLVDAGSGERTVLWHGDRRTTLRPEDVGDDVLRAAALVHLDATMPEVACSCARRARAAGVRIAVDLDTPGPGVTELIELADLCIVPVALAAELAGTAEPERALRHLAARCPGLAVVTLGARGAAALVDGAVVTSPAFAVRAVDTTGCGDVFHAAAIAASLRGLPPPQLLRYANAAAALAARRLGARAGCPTPAEVEALLRQEP